MKFPILTAEEKRIVTFVLAAFMLGLGTKIYRDYQLGRDRAPALQTEAR